MINGMPIEEIENEVKARAEVKTGEQYLVYRIKKLEDRNRELQGAYQHSDWQVNQLGEENHKLKEEIRDNEAKIKDLKNDYNACLDYRNGLFSLVEMFGWKAVTKTTKKEVKCYLVDKNKKQIEVSWDIYYAVKKVNQRK